MPGFPMSGGSASGDAPRLLVRGGLAIADGEVTKYDPTLDPEGATRLAGWLADRARPLEPSVVAVWEEPEDMILAHLVALHLGLHWIRCSERDGYVAISGAIGPADSVVFVTDALRSQMPLEAVRRAIELRGARLVGTCVFLATPRLSQCGPEFGPKIALVIP